MGLRENLGQFSLLVLINAFVGAMVGIERAILPLMAEQGFGLASRAAILSFVAAFGIAKAAANYAAGHACDRLGRKRVLLLGWVLGLPVPLLLIWAPSWGWVVAANGMLGVHQGLAWSTTVIMKIDLVGSRQRGLAMGLNEFAGYLAVALLALAAAQVAARWGLRPPFYLGLGIAALGLLLSAVVRETSGHAAAEASAHAASDRALSAGEVFRRTSFIDRNLSAASQAGLVNNLNDGMAWGLLPLLFAESGLTVDRIGWLAALYPATWGIAQLATGPLSDRVGRRWPIAIGMWAQAAALAALAVASHFGGFAVASLTLGFGTALVYPTLLAAVGDAAPAAWRASAVGVYRLWRDLGYAVGAVLSGVVADAFGLRSAVMAVAALTFAPDAIAAARMRDRSSVSAE